MFTGIVAAVGHIVRVQPAAAGGQKAGLRLDIDAGSLDLAGVRDGDSIAVQGACMTVVGLQGQRFAVDISRESLNLTVGLDREGAVNLETSLRLGDQIGGHMVSGHVDGIGEVLGLEPAGESREFRVRAPLSLARYLAYKGSVTVNGVSLTVNRVHDHEQGCDISINLIPHTLSVTTLGQLQAGSRVNLEIDSIARYVERVLGAPGGLGAAAR